MTAYTGSGAEEASRTGILVQETSHNGSSSENQWRLVA